MSERTPSRSTELGQPAVAWDVAAVGVLDSADIDNEPEGGEDDNPTFLHETDRQQAVLDVPTPIGEVGEQYLDPRDPAYVKVTRNIRSVIDRADDSGEATLAFHELFTASLDRKQAGTRINLEPSAHAAELMVERYPHPGDLLAEMTARRSGDNADVVKLYDQANKYIPSFMKAVYGDRYRVYLDQVDQHKSSLGSDDIEPAVSGRRPELISASPEDQANRVVGQEILGNSVRFRHDVADKAVIARSSSDKLLTKLRNGVEWPDRKVAEWHVKRAEASHRRRQGRVDNKGLSGRFHDWRSGVAQTKIDELRGPEPADEEANEPNRIEQFRQSKIDKKIAKQQSKIDKHQEKIAARRQARQARVDAYAAGTLAERRGAESELTDKAEQRSQGAETRSIERQAEIDKARSEAIARKQAALGRKALRAELRQAGATRIESRKIIEQMQQEADGTVVRELGRKVFAGQQAELAHKSSRSQVGTAKESFARSSSLLERAEKVSQQLPELIESTADKQEQLSQELDYLDAQADQVTASYGATSPQLAELEKYRQTIEDQMEESIQVFAQLMQQNRALPAQIVKLRHQSERELADYERLAAIAKQERQQAEAMQQSLRHDARAALGLDPTASNHNNQQEKN